MANQNKERNFGANECRMVVNLNTASKEELKQLEGIDDQKAAKILEYRKKKGRFGNLDEVSDIPGLGSRSAEEIKKCLTL